MAAGLSREKAGAMFFRQPSGRLQYVGQVRPGLLSAFKKLIKKEK
jgi:hypothetical protein